MVEWRSREQIRNWIRELCRVDVIRVALVVRAHFFAGIQVVHVNIARVTAYVTV